MLKKFLLLILFAFICIVVILAYTTKADNEPNDDFNQAESITIETYYGNVNRTDKNDFYKISLNSGEVLYANLTRLATMRNINISFYDEEKIFVFGDAKYEDNNEVIKILWATNSSKINYTYYIEIRNIGNATNPYKLQVGKEKQNDINSNKDAGDEFNSSIEVPKVNITYKNNILGNYDKNDYYKIKLEEEEYFKIKINSTVNYDLYLYNENYTLIAFSDNYTTEKTISWAVNSSKQNFTFYILVYGKNFTKYSFDFFMSKQNDGNSSKDAKDEIENSTTIIAGIYLNIIGGGDTHDFYKIIVDGGDKIEVKVNQNLYLYLYNENKEEKVNTTKEFSWITSSSKQKFTFYILVYGKNFTEYILEIFISKQNDANSGRDGADNFEDAFFISQGKHEGILQDDDKKDIYAINCDGEEMKIELKGDFTASIYGEDKLLRIKGKFISWLTSSKKYYILIEGNGKYSFNIILTKQNDINSNKDAGNNFENALYVEKGKYYNNKIGNDDNYDYYKISIEAKKTIIVKADNLNISIFDMNYLERGRIWENKKIWHSQISQTIYIRIESFSFKNYFLEISFSSSRPPDIIGFKSYYATNDQWTKINDLPFIYGKLTSEFGIRGYYYTIDGTEPNLNSEFTPETSFTLIDIPDGIYTIKISAVDYADAFGNVSTFILKVDTKKPSKVKLEIKEITENSIKVSWNKNEEDDFARYEIEYSTYSDFSVGKLIPITDKEKTEYKIDGLSPGTTYYIKITVVDATGEKSDADIIQISTKQRFEIPIFLIFAIVIIAFASLFTLFFIRRRKMPKKKKLVEKKKPKEKEIIVEKKEKIKPKEKLIEEEISGEELWKQLRKRK